VEAFAGAQVRAKVMQQYFLSIPKRIEMSAEERERREALCAAQAASRQSGP
jgi:hypothetical protein